MSLLLITDGKNPIALAGIMGGHSSAVSDDTTNIFIESAYFNPVTIRKGSKDLSISTEASKRFERGADPEATVAAFWRVVNLIEECANGRFDGDFVDYYPKKISIKPIEIRKNEIELILGLKIEDDFIIATLKGLGFNISKNSIGFNCTPPTNRPDITREIDVIEEIARIYGYDNIPTDNSLYGSYSLGQTDSNSHFQSIIETLSGFGFHQIYSNSLQSENIANFPNNDSVQMMNPLSKDMSFLRTSLLPGLVKAADYNIKNSTHSFKLYELDCIHKQVGAKIEDNIMVGTFGKLSEKLFKILKVDKYDIYSFDLDIETVLSQRKTLKYNTVNIFPKISRRINLVLEVSASVGPIIELIEKKCYKNLTDVYPVEIFEDNVNIGEDKKSVTFEMVFQDREKTLEDKDVNPIIDEIIDIAEKDFNAKLRL